MTEINDPLAFVKVIDATTPELFADATLTTAFDNSGFSNYIRVGKIGLRRLNSPTRYPYTSKRWYWRRR